MIYTAEQLRKTAKDSRINLDKLMEECKEKASDYDNDYKYKIN